MTAVRTPTFPLFATAYYPDAWPEAEWRRDLLAIKAAGLTAVRWGEFSWGYWEREPGVYDFAATDRFVQLVGEVGLELILCTPTATPPSWLIARHRDHLIVDQFGESHLGGRHYGCVNHPGFLAKAEALISRLAARYAGVPHLVGWQIDNETNLGECNQGRWYDYHPLTLAAWRRWIEAKYRTIDALNTAWVATFWSRTYASFADVDPPRPKLGMVNQTAFVDWCAFRSENLAGFVHWQRDLLRRHCPGVSVGTNIPDVNPTAMVHLAQDYWAQAAGLDWAATDLYAFRKDPNHERRFLAYETDLMRSALTAEGQRFFIMETQAGPHNVPWRMDFVGGFFGPEYPRQCGETYIDHGADGVCHFLWRPWTTGVECGMNGIVDVDGSPTERSIALPATLAAARARHAARPAAVRPAVIHYGADSLALCLGNDPELTANTALPGWHALLDEAGIGCQFADNRRLAERAWTAGDIAVCAYSPMLDDGCVTSLGRALDAGARLLVGQATGMFDGGARLVAPRPRGLTARLGWRQLATDHLSGPHAWTLGGAPITGNAARVAVTDGRVLLASDAGLPLLIVSPCGRALSATCDVGSLVWARGAAGTALAAAVVRWLRG
jgi:beta-galactosidase